MKRLTFLWVLFAGLAMGLQAQPLDEEIGFKLVKAEYLINTERFEDAIKELNAVILENPNYKKCTAVKGRNQIQAGGIQRCQKRCHGVHHQSWHYCQGGIHFRQI
ncbi:MAG: hypothetical protein IPO65_06140 [Saprospiraceae bacterium]|nr:hypothetical protein [Saprospiraceae bacterium]